MTASPDIGCPREQFTPRFRTALRAFEGRTSIRTFARWNSTPSNRLGFLLWVGICAFCGCSSRSASTFSMVDYREAARPRDYREEFPEAYYDVDDEGNIDIVLRQAADASEKDHGAFSQVVYLRAFWTPIPGRTVADATQINACVSYMVIGAGFGAAFEGAGALFFKQNRRGDEIKGKLERASLRPVRALRGASPPFDRTELSGEFRAVRDRRRVSRIVNEMNREFGPLPPYPPSPRTAAGN